MKKIICFIISVCFISVCFSQNSTKTLSDFEWLLGKWERTNGRPGQATYEHWTKESDTKFTGFGWTMKGKDTAFVEKFSLMIKDNDIYYVADVSQNPAPVWFKITEHTNNTFVSSNPKHDFPKMIGYKMESESLMTATISGDGKEIPYKFKKIE